MNYSDNNRSALSAQYGKFAKYKETFQTPESVMEDLVSAATAEDIAYNEEEYLRSKPLIMLQIKALVARDLFEMGAYYQIINDDNETYREALRLINDEAAYKQNLSLN